MIIRKTLDQATAEKGQFDAEKFESLADADSERMIAETRIWRRRPSS
jgi:hypothetical protein